MNGEITGVSKIMLENFLKFCVQKKVFPIIVGGWAVWSFAKSEFSVDVDFVLKNRAELKKIRPFFEKNGFIEEKENGLSFVKKVSEKGLGNYQLKHVILEVLFFNEKSVLAEDEKISIPWNLAGKNSIKTKIDGIPATVPCIELLLIQKVKALRDRTFLKYKIGSFSQALDRKRREFKIEKDKRDIQNLLKLKIDNKKLNRLLEKTKFTEYFNETISEIKRK